VRKKGRTPGIHREKGERTKEEEERKGGIFAVFPTGATSPNHTGGQPCRNTTQGPLNAPLLGPVETREAGAISAAAHFRQTIIARNHMYHYNDEDNKYYEKKGTKP